MSIQAIANQAELSLLATNPNQRQGYVAVFKKLMKEFPGDKMSQTAALSSLYILITEGKCVTARAIAVGAKALGISKKNENYRQLADKIDQEVHTRGCNPDGTIRQDMHDAIGRYLVMIEQSLGKLAVSKEPVEIWSPEYTDTNIHGVEFKTKLIKSTLWRQMPKFKHEFYLAVNMLNNQGYKINGDLTKLINLDPETEQDYINRIKRLRYDIGIDGEYLFRNTFYFRYTFDYRGRAYARSTVISPQGDKFSKAALRFDEKKPLGRYGLNALAIVFAGVCGLDKISYLDRIKWAKTTGIQHARDMLAAEGDWLKIKDICMDSSFVEYTTALEFLRAATSPNPELYESDFILHQDATNSGFQFGAALLGDKVLATSANITKGLSKSDIPNDLYKDMAKSLLVIAKPLEVFNNIINYINRDMCKKPVMVSGYGAGSKTAAKNALEYLIKSKDKSGAGRPDLAVQFLSTDWDQIASIDEYLDEDKLAPLQEIIEQALAMTAGGMIELTNTLKEWMKIVIESGNTSLVWDTQDGFRVQHDHTLNDHIDIGVLKINSFTDEIDEDKLKGALAPNFIHSIDAQLLRTTAIDAYYEDVALSPIHDSFGTHASTYFRLNSILKESFVTTMDYKWFDALQAHVDIPLKVRVSSDYDYHEALHSIYMFS